MTTRLLQPEASYPFAMKVSSQQLESWRYTSGGHAGPMHCFKIQVCQVTLSGLLNVGPEFVGLALVKVDEEDSSIHRPRMVTDTTLNSLIDPDYPNSTFLTEAGFYDAKRLCDSLTNACQTKIRFIVEQTEQRAYLVVKKGTFHRSHMTESHRLHAIVSLSMACKLGIIPAIRPSPHDKMVVLLPLIGYASATADQSVLYRAPYPIDLFADLMNPYMVTDQPNAWTTYDTDSAEHVVAKFVLDPHTVQTVSPCVQFNLPMMGTESSIIWRSANPSIRLGLRTSLGDPLPLADHAQLLPFIKSSIVLD